MDMLKRHLFLIICGVAAVGGIALGVMGMTSMSKVTDEMQGAAQLASDLSRLGFGPAGPINQAAIDAQNERIEQLRTHHENVLAWVRDHNRHQPLLPDIFPEPTRDQGLDFRAAYKPRLRQLLEVLGAGRVASDQDIADAQVEINEEQKFDSSFGLDSSETGGSGTPTAEEEKPEYLPSGLMTDAGARVSAAARANIARAHQMRCYASFNSLEALPLPGITPNPQDMWDAQLSLWVQEDVVAALARVNDRTARKLEDAGETAWVGVLPLKELVSIRTSPYVFPDSPPKPVDSPAGTGAAYPPESGEMVFTHTVSGDLFEVVQFSVKMVVDARALPEIVAELCKDNLHTPLRIVYEDMSKDPENWAMTDRIYGSAPT
ncbi:MAG: hypothetical protein IID40_11505, partial [Planctomycetes bacterium]|nr:hypothetical protein [Planctomycetota bacterium]